MTIEDYRKLIIESASSAIGSQNKDGTFPAGHNNKWNDLDTPVRVTSHFVIQLIYAYLETREMKFFDAAVRAGEFLLSREARPAGKTFFCRVSSGKSLCNGLIGQAWPIEALVHLSRVTSDEKYVSLAKDVFTLHPFSRDYGLYCPVEVDGRVLPPAKTMNHQLIFGAVGMGLLSLGCMDIRDNLTRFYRGLESTFSINSEGLINHHARYGRSAMMKNVFDASRYFHRLKLSERSIGYHSFNLFGLALAHWFFPEFEVWQDRGFRKNIDRVLDFSRSPSYIQNLESNDFALQYRLTGQELLLFQLEFSPVEQFKEAEALIARQFINHWDPTRRMLGRNSGDPKTLSARLYEMTYLYMKK